MLLIKQIGPFPQKKRGGKIPTNILVGGFNPFEKYARQNGFIFPNFRGENKNIWTHHPAFELPPTQSSSPSIPETGKKSMSSQETLGRHETSGHTLV